MFVSFVLAGVATLSTASEHKSPEPPEVQCVQERMAKASALDVSARILAAQIADKCSDLYVYERFDCGLAQARCDQVKDEARTATAQNLEQYTYHMLLLRRQAAKR